jgi:multiple sugar transport system substrate-binding protein
MLQKKFLTVLLSCLLVLFMFTIVYAQGVPTASDAKIDWKMFSGKSIRVFVPTHPYIDGIKPLIPQFEELTGIKVILEEASEQEFFKKIILDLSSGKPTTDAFMAVHFAIAQYAKGNWLEPLMPYLENSQMTDQGWFDFEDFPPVSLVELTYKDVLHGIPIMTEQMTLFYKKDLFEEKGLGVPDTTDELYETAKKINSPEIAGIVLRMKRGEGPDWPWNTFLCNYGGVWVDKENQPHVNSPEALAATEMYVKLMKDAGPQGALNYSWYEGSSDFSQGKLAMFIDAQGFVGQFEDPEKSKVAGNVGYGLMPASPNGRCVGGSTAWSWAIPSGSQNKDASWLFVEWVTSKEVAAQAALVGWIARTSMWSLPALKENFPTNWLDVNLEGIKNYSSNYTYPQVTVMQKLADIISVALQEAFTGIKTVQQALDDAQTEHIKALEGQ